MEAKGYDAPCMAYTIGTEEYPGKAYCHKGKENGEEIQQRISFSFPSFFIFSGYSFDDLIETMIFDEIDAGISGRTAQMVAEKMNVIGKNHQVICITHLPQIAAMADHHFLIEKSVVDQSTISTIKPLSEEESIGELARMIGGVKVTDTVEKSAREMKELALAVKKKKQ